MKFPILIKNISILDIFYKMDREEYIKLSHELTRAGDWDGLLKLNEAVYEWIKLKVIYSELKEKERLQERLQHPGPMEQILSTISIPEGHILYIEAQSGDERCLWHEWADQQKYPYHCAVKTFLFDEVLIYKCPFCKECFYEEERKVKTDYGLVPDYYEYCPWCGDMIDSDDGMKSKPVYNAVMIANTKTFPKFPKTVGRRNKRSLRRKTIVETPFSTRFRLASRRRYVILPETEPFYIPKK